MSVKVRVKLDVGSMADFMVYHIYASKAGYIAKILGVFNIALTVAFALRQNFLMMGVCCLFAFLLLALFPYFIRCKVKKQMEHSSRIEELVTYEFDEDGITTTTSADSGKASWGKFKKAVSKKRILFLYDEKKRAIILPVDQLGEDYTGIVDLIYAHMPAPAVRIRRLDGKKG